MKKSFLRLFALAICGAVLFIACSKEKEPIPAFKDNAGSGTLNIDGKSYELIEASQSSYARFNDDDEGTYQIDLDMETAGFNDLGGGIGTIISFYTYSSDSTKILPGTYNFYEGDDLPAFTFDDGYIDVNMNADSLESEEIWEIVAGTVRLKENTNSTFDIVFNGNAILYGNEGEILKTSKFDGSYTGELLTYEIED